MATAEVTETPLPETIQQQLAGHLGNDRFDRLFDLIERYQQEDPQLALQLSQEAIDLLDHEDDPRRRSQLLTLAAGACWLLGEVDQGSLWAGQAATLAARIGAPEEEFSALYVQSAVDRLRGQPEAALAHGRRMEELAANPLEKVRALTVQAIAHRSMEKPSAALDSYLEALRVGRQLPRDPNIGDLLNNIGRVYAHLGQYEEAIRYARQSLDVFDELAATRPPDLADQRSRAYCLYNLADYEIALRDFSPALKHLEEASAIAESLGDEGQASIYMLSNRAVALAELGRGAEAIPFTQKAEQRARSKQRPKWIARTLADQGRVYQLLGRLPMARDKLMEALEITQTIEDRKQQAAVSGRLAALYEAMGEPSLALRYYRLEQETRKELREAEHERRIAEWQVRLETAKTDWQLASADHLRQIQAKELERQRTVRTALVTILLLLTASGTGALFSFRRQRQAHRDLGDAHQRLRTKKRKLEKALSQVNLLSGLLPICATCKNIRDDQGYWLQVEQYIEDHSEAQFSHSLCPSCVQELYPDLDLGESKSR